MNISNSFDFNKVNEGGQTFKNKTNLIAMLRDLIMAVIVIWLVCPYQAFFSNWNIYGALWIVWIILAFVTDSKAFIHMIKSKYTAAAFSWPCTIFVLSLFDWANFAIYQFTIVFMISAFVYYAFGNHIKSLKFLVAVFIIYSVMICLYSIQELQINPEISRILANSDKKITSKFAGPFMANFSFVNSAALVALVFTFYVGYAQKLYTKIVVIFMVLLEFYLIFCAQYSIALFLFLIYFVIVSLFLGKKKNNTRITKLFAFIIILLLIPFMGNILLFISENMQSGYVQRRVQSIGEIFIGSELDSGSDLAERLNLYWLSVSTFLQNFFVGVGGAVYGANGLVGGHSQILDNFAYYGVLFGTQFVWYLICVYKNGAKFFKGNFKKIYKLIFSAYMIQCVLNTSYNDEMLFVIYFAVPSMIYLIQHNNLNPGDKIE